MFTACNDEIKVVSLLTGSVVRSLAGVKYFQNSRGYSDFLFEDIVNNTTDVYNFRLCRY